MATEFMIRNLMIFETNFHIPYKKDLKKIVNVKNATKKQLGWVGSFIDAYKDDTQSFKCFKLF